MTEATNTNTAKSSDSDGEKQAVINDITAFASKAEGNFEERFTQTVEYAFVQHGIFLQARELRRVVGGGAHATAKLVIDRHRKMLHSQFTQRASAEVLSEWMDAGMPACLIGLSPKERLIASSIQKTFAQAAARY